jgi:photosystem II stability/assembly factor-like uncharacterized protein
VQFEVGNSSTILMYTTNDGGKTWTCMGEAPVSSSSLIQFIDSKNAYALDNTLNNNKLYMTSDGGKSWSLRSQISTQRINVWHFNNLLDDGYPVPTPVICMPHMMGATWTAVK